MLNTTVSHYRIVEHLGGGGMGVVYKAEDTKLGRTVALKFLPPEWSRDPDSRERFLREARAASALEDSRICTIFDIDETVDGQLFIAMAYYQGETLKKRLKRGRLPLGEAVDIAIQVAEGLESAHSAEILHRDIKPANLMLTGHDEVVIVDFGLAKLAGDFTLTKPGSSLGTPHYMSPEQARGERLGGRTDLWSLGVVLYEMLTGERPFAGENHTAVARAILDDEPPNLHMLRPDAPRELGAIVSRALEKDADKRYQDASELLADLRTLKEQLSEVEGVTLSAPSQTRGRRRFPFALVLVSAALVLGTAAVLWFIRSGTVAKPSIEAAPPRIVVLPFENLGPPEDEYFADGITEEITSRLAAVSGLRVISRMSAMYYKDRSVPLQQITRDLDVDYVLEGTIRWEPSDEGGGKVRITPQLIDTTDDTHLWSDQYDRDLAGIFDVQSDIAIHVVENLRVSLLESERSAVEKVLSDNPDAIQAYYRALHHSALNDFAQHQLRGMMLKKAVALDPSFATAWAALARNHCFVFFTGADPAESRRDAGKHALDRALSLGLDTVDEFWHQGYYLYYCRRDFEGAIAAYESALNVRPYHERALRGKAWILRRQGEWEQSTDIMLQVLRNSPKDYFTALNLSISFANLRDLDRAIKYADVAIEIRPDRVDGYSVKYRGYFQFGRIADARAVLQDVPFSSRSFLQHWIHVELGMREYESALATVRASTEEDFRSIVGVNALGLRAVHECVCCYFLNDKAGVDDACSRARSSLEAAALEYPEEPWFHRNLGKVNAILGRKSEAIREARLAMDLRPVSRDAYSGADVLKDVAVVYSIAGETELAISQLEYLLSIPSPLTVGHLWAHPDWDPLRDHPRFQALLEEYDSE